MLANTRRKILAAGLAVLFSVALSLQPRVASAEPLGQSDLPVITLRPGQAAAGVGMTAVPLDAATYIENGRTMAPLRFTAESFGAQVEWTADHPLDVVITDGTTRIQLTRGDSTAYVNGKSVTLDAPPELVDNRTFVPVRFVSEALSAQVLYDAATQTVVISRLDHAPTLSDLEHYTLQLINLDRLVNSLEPLAWDETAATAGRGHAQEMAQSGYFAHWGLDGQLPSYRYTKAGGQDYDEENLAKIWYEGGDASSYPAPDLLRVVSHEAGLMQSPGHRRNILDPYHTHAGVGIAVDSTGGTYMAQEFINRYGAYDPLSPQITLGQGLRVSGTIGEGAQFYGISLGYVDAQPMTVAQLNQTRTYSEPSPYASFFPKGYVTPTPVLLTGRQFSLDIPASQFQKAGTYYVYIWAVRDGETSPFLISARTVNAR